MKGNTRKRALLALADGTVFEGTAFGAEAGRDNPAVGEVVFNTSMYGYQEIVTDPSYHGQILCFTYPHIGNVGCNAHDMESPKVQVEGVILKNLSAVSSNFRSEQDFDQFLTQHGVMGLADIDTRRLVKHIRDAGAQMGAMACGSDVRADELIAAARAKGTLNGKDLVQYVTCREPYSWNELPWSLTEGYQRVQQNELWARPHVVALDCGIKYNILRLLLHAGFRVTVAPAYTKPEEIRALSPDALFISNGPGDPAALTEIVTNVRGLLGKLPIFGICLGHQILAQAFGGKTFKLKFGHRGGNHPVMDMKTEAVEITVQNHGFAVDADSMPGDVRISHLNLNDRTVEGLEVPDAKTFCIQYHPEASPGPHDSRYLFTRFFESVVGYRTTGA